MSYVVPAQLTAQLSSYPTLFSAVGSAATYGQLTAATGNFASLQAATGTFASVQSAGWYTSGGAQLTQTAAAFSGTLSSTGAGTMLWTPVVARNISTNPSGSYVQGVMCNAGSWYRASYSLALSTIPAAAKISAQLSVGGTLLPDSSSYWSNLAPTSSIGTNTAVPQQGVLAGFSHFVPQASGTLILNVANSGSGTCVLAGGSLEVFQMQ